MRKIEVGYESHVVPEDKQETGAKSQVEYGIGLDLRELVFDTVLKKNS